ncbi:MAG: transposase, partial [Candidatus Tectomicrobia bacterium]|nr:transposase [Candidatus Tectomicrobia bacterium]
MTAGTGAGRIQAAAVLPDGLMPLAVEMILYDLYGNCRLPSHLSPAMHVVQVHHGAPDVRRVRAHRSGVDRAPAHHQLVENGLMFRIVRIPPSLDTFFHPLQSCFHWDHFTYFRWLVLVTAFAWGRRNVANLYRYLEARHHRTRFNHFFLVQRWDPEAALRQKAHELLRALHPGPGETLYMVIDDSKKAKRGKAMDAVTKMKEPMTNTYIQGHQYVCAILVLRDAVIPYGIRLYVKQEQCAALGRPFHKTTQLAAELIREFQTPPGVKV